MIYWLAFLALALVVAHNARLFLLGSWQLYRGESGYWDTQKEILDSFPTSVIGGICAVVIMVVTGG